MTTVTNIQKNINMPTRKLQLVADMVRKMKPMAALQVLTFTNKAAATPLAKAIKTAIANAKQQNLVDEDLVFKKLEINEGSSLKRFRAGSRGRAKPYKKRVSHIKVVLEELKINEKGEEK